MAADSFRDFVLDQLADLGGLRCTAMFGGYGLYRGQAFFGILHKGRPYFKTDAITRLAYVERGMKPFQPKPGTVLKNYYEVPPDIIEDTDTLVGWARRAIMAQSEATPIARPKRKRKRKLQLKNK